MAKYISLENLETFLTCLQSENYKASSTKYGAIKINDDTDDTANSTKRSVKLDGNGYAYIDMAAASDSNFGAIKTAATAAHPNWRPLKKDDKGAGYVQLYDSEGNIGSATMPIFIDTQGKFAASNASIGASAQAIYMENGSLTPITKTIGSTTKPIYLKDGEFVEGADIKDVVTSTDVSYDPNNLDTSKLGYKSVGAALKGIEDVLDSRHVTEILINPDFYQFDANGNPKGWVLIGSRDTISFGSDNVMIEPGSCIYQDVKFKADTKYKFSFETWPSLPDSDLSNPVFGIEIPTDTQIVAFRNHKRRDVNYNKSGRLLTFTKTEYEAEIFTLEFIVNSVPSDIRFYLKHISGSKAVVFSKISLTIANAIEYLDSKITELESKPPMMEVSYSQLSTLRSNKELIPGVQYKITDYRTTVGYNNRNPNTGGLWEYCANHDFDIIVTAEGVDSLSHLAKAARKENDTYFANCNLDAWQLWYDLDNDQTKYDWASTSGKGVIYRMIDEYGNDCPYDFKNILFTSEFITDYYRELGNTSYDKARYTFNYIDASGKEYDATVFGGTCKHNVIKECYSKELGNFTSCRILNKITFRLDQFTILRGCSQNTLDINCCDILFVGACMDNSFERECQNNVIGLDGEGNIFGQYCSNNKLRAFCDNNIFGHSCSSNVLASECSANSFGQYCRNNTLDESCCNNRFGNSCTNNSLATNAGSNILMDGCKNNQLFPVAIGNTLNMSCENNKIYDYCENNTLGIGCKDNSIGTNSEDNICGDYCENNTLCGNNHNITFGQSCIYNEVGPESGAVSLGAGCTYNHLGVTTGTNVNGSVNHIEFLDNCRYNNVGANSTNIKLGCRCEYNIFGESFDTIEDERNYWHNTYIDLCDGLSTNSFIGLCENISLNNPDNDFSGYYSSANNNIKTSNKTEYEVYNSTWCSTYVPVRHPHMQLNSSNMLPYLCFENPVYETWISIPSYNDSVEYQQRNGYGDSDKFYINDLAFEPSGLAIDNIWSPGVMILDAVAIGTMYYSPLYLAAGTDLRIGRNEMVLWTVGTNMMSGSDRDGNQFIAEPYMIKLVYTKAVNPRQQDTPPYKPGVPPPAGSSASSASEEMELDEISLDEPIPTDEGSEGNE